MRVLWLVNIPLPPVRERQGLPEIPGGGWLSATLSALRASAPDTEITCVARSWPAPETFSSEGVRYVTLPRERASGGVAGVAERWFPSDGVAALESALRDLVDDVRPDVIHVHGTETANALAALGAAGSTPVLVSIQGSTSECSRRYLDGMTARDLVADVVSLEFIKGRGLVHEAREMRRDGARELRALAAASDVAGRTEWDRDLVARVNPRARYWRMDEALREPFYRNRWRGPDGDEPTIVAVASAAPFKGIDVLLKALARVRERRACTLRVAGRIVGSAMWPSLRRLEARLGLAGSVDWTGVLGPEDVAEMLAACSAAVCASRIENSSNGVCEAMLVGAPVAASRVGGLPSLITHGSDGLLFSPGDDHALADTIIGLLDDADLARRIGTQARLTAESRHDPATVGRRIADVYVRLVSGAGA